MAQLYRGGRLQLSDGDHLTALLVDQGRIAWMGTESEADSLDPSGATVTQLGGALVTPGFVDAHVHATSTGLTLIGLDLSGVTSAQELVEEVSQSAGAHPGSVILGHGWDESTWQDTALPTADDIDRATRGALVYLTRADAHSALVSRALLASVPEVAGLTGYSASGWLTQEAHHAVRDHALASIDTRTVDRAQRAFLQRAASCGIVSVHEMAGPVISSAEDCAHLLSLASEMGGTRVFAYWGELAQSGGISKAREIGAIATGGDLFVDGSLGSHTACLHSPYSDQPDTAGREFINGDSLVAHVDACVRAGQQTGFHAIGDLATDAVVEAYVAAASTHGVEAIRRLRHRIEHAESMSLTAILECARLGIIASMQPAFDARWGGDEGMYARRLGLERARSLNAIADLRATGVSVAFGSDAPVTPLDPWGAIHAAMQHRTASQRIDLESAMRAHTRAGWHAAGMDHVGGLEAGAPAHLAIWAPTQLIPAPGATSLRTVIDGVIAWDSGELEDSRC